MKLRRYPDRATAGGVGVAHWGQPGSSHRGSGAAGWYAPQRASAPRVRRRAQMRAAIGTQAEGGRAAAAANNIVIDPAARAVLPTNRAESREPRAEPSRVSRAELSRAGSSLRHAELSRCVAPPSRAAEPRRQQQQSRATKPHAQTKPLAHELRRKTQMHDLAAAHEDVLDVERARPLENPPSLGSVPANKATH
jgi:hypothetical protein